MSEVSCFKECLDKYALWSGQLLTRHKSAVHCSSNISPQAAMGLASLLGLQCLPTKLQHLGLPLIFPNARSSILVAPHDRIISKISGWKAKLLSYASRTTLISAVASALPSYNMSSLLLPLDWCKMMDRQFKNFWWGFDPLKSRNLSLKSWSSICRPKCEGGLGLRLLY